MTPTLILKTLKSQLATYGLNPNEWLIVQNNAETHESFLVCHRQDPNFKLMGSMLKDPSGFWRLGSLKLESL